MYDVDGNAQPGMTTANCYVVRAPGTYRLPLVYGNAVKDGVTNTDSFNPGAVANVLSAFPKHDDGAIVAPCLTDNPGVVPEDAVLLWNDGLNTVSGSGFYWTAGLFGRRYGAMLLFQCVVCLSGERQLLVVRFQYPSCPGIAIMEGLSMHALREKIMINSIF